MSERSHRAGSVGVHMDQGRRYTHVDLTAHPLRNRRVRHKATLLHKALLTVDQRYAAILDAEERLALHDAVLRILRPMLRAEWSEIHAEARALEIAAELLGHTTHD